MLENLRAFDRLDFRFERSNGKYAGWTVITGDNASGKTSFLKAIALALVGPDAARALQPSLRGWIRSDQNESIIAVEISLGDEDRFSQGRRPERPVWAELHLKKMRDTEVALEVGRTYTGKGKGSTHGPWTENPEGWFCVGYGPFRRLYGASPTAQRIMSNPGRVARFVTMFLEDATLGECELWLIDLNHKKLEGQEKAAKVLDQVLRLLNDEFLRNGLRVEKVDSEGVWLTDASNVTLRLADMSEGYRAALAMLVDILRHMVGVYGHENIVQEVDGRLAVVHPGVVLIDEVDSHLHPEWQRLIGFWLKERFPHVQFIVTTHSPMICQAADPGGIFHLPSAGRGEPFQLSPEDCDAIIRSQPNAIYVSPAFGMANTRSPRAVVKRQELARLRAKKAAGCSTQAENAQLNQLEFWGEDVDEPGDAAECVGSDVSN